MTRLHWIFAGVCALALQGAAMPASAQSQYGEGHGSEYWPCIQRQVIGLQPGQMWAGPPVDEIGGEWRSDAEVARLVPLLAARRTSQEEAGEALDAFAEGAGADKDERLALLFAGLFQRLDSERTRVIRGLERYGQKQRDLSERIKDTRFELAGLRDGNRPMRDGTVAAPRRDGGDATPDDPSDDDYSRFETDLDERLFWDTRIYDERNRALVYVCDSPVIIEQHLFGLARAIQQRLG